MEVEHRPVPMIEDLMAAAACELVASTAALSERGKLTYLPLIGLE